MDNNTLALIIVLLLALNLLFVGFYIILVLKEVRKAAKRINSMLETTDHVLESLSKPFVEASGLLVGLTKGIQLVNSLRNSHSPKEEEEDEEE